MARQACGGLHSHAYFTRTRGCGCRQTPGFFLCSRSGKDSQTSDAQRRERNRSGSGEEPKGVGEHGVHYAKLCAHGIFRL